jgi:multidrug efflux system membrane fusion protein
VRNITTGVADGGMTDVQGINPGEVVATSSFDKLQAGSRIVVSKQAVPVSPAGSNIP